MFTLNIYTPAKAIASFKARHVRFPIESGYLGVGENHAPFTLRIKPGILSVKTESQGTVNYFVSKGVAQVVGNKAHLLIESSEAPSDLDRKRAEKAEQRALDRLKNLTPSVNIPRAIDSLERARKRILLADQGERLFP